MTEDSAAVTRIAPLGRQPRWVAPLASIGAVAIFATRLVAVYRTGPRFPGECVRHAADTVVRGFVPVCVIVAAFGAVVALQGLEIFRIFGTETMLPSLVVIAILREAAPTFSGIMLAAQAGSSVAAELAVMNVKEELDATEIMSVDPLKFHVAPRVIGLVFAGPLLTVLSAAAGIGAAWVITVQLAGVSHGAFRENMFGFLTGTDLLAGFLKSGSYALLTGIVATYQGVHAERNALGVGRAANRAVVLSIVCIVVVNYLLTSALFGASS